MQECDWGDEMNLCENENQSWGTGATLGAGVFTTRYCTGYQVKYVADSPRSEQTCSACCSFLATDTMSVAFERYVQVTVMWCFDFAILSWYLLVPVGTVGMHYQQRAPLTLHSPRVHLASASLGLLVPPTAASTGLVLNR